MIINLHATLQKLLDKYRLREEEELTNTNLDQGEALKDASAGPSMLDEAAVELEEQSSTSIRTFEIIRVIGNFGPLIFVVKRINGIDIIAISPRVQQITDEQFNSGN